MSLFRDRDGEISSTRVLLYIWTLFIAVLATHSIIAAVDFGANVTGLLTTITSSLYIGIFGKMGAEQFKKEKK